MLLVIVKLISPVGLINGIVTAVKSEYRQRAGGDGGSDVVSPLLDQSQADLR